LFAEKDVPTEKESEMETETLYPAAAADLIRRQETLQTEGTRVLEGLNLVALLSPLGMPQFTGSFASGLMTWRDIDVQVVAPGLDIAKAFDTIGRLAGHPRIHRIRYMSESGTFNPTGQLRDERSYFGVYYAPDEGEEWKLDVSFWLKDVSRSELKDLEEMRSRLTPELRLSILWIKDVWCRLPAYRTQVFSMDIYEAVLEHGVKTPAGFEHYLAERGKPARQL
jgi:hypothetical protein